MYSQEGELFARSCCAPFTGVKKKRIIIDRLRPESKFFVKEHTSGILSLTESITKITHDYLVVDDTDCSNYNIALFVFCCRALSYHGYAPNGKICMKPDQKQLSLDIKNGYVRLKIENNSVIFCKGQDTSYAKHIGGILNELCVKQYSNLTFIAN